MPRLRVRSQVGAPTVGSRSTSLSHISVSLSPFLSKIYTYISPSSGPRVGIKTTMITNQTLSPSLLTQDSPGSDGPHFGASHADAPPPFPGVRTKRN